MWYKQLPSYGLYDEDCDDEELFDTFPPEYRSVPTEIIYTSRPTCLSAEAAPISWNKINLSDNLGHPVLIQNYSYPVTEILRQENITDVIVPNSSLDEIINYLTPRIAESVLDKIRNVTPIMTTTLNPEYDPKQQYIPRSMRKERSPVDLLGKIHVYNNGQCEPGSKCDCTNGIAVPGTKWYVLNRVSSNIIRVLFR